MKDDYQQLMNELMDIQTDKQITRLFFFFAEKSVMPSTLMKHNIPSSTSKSINNSFYGTNTVHSKNPRMTYGINNVNMCMENACH